MDKFTFGNYTDTGDLAYASTKGYVNPTSESERRKQLSSPLGQLRDYANSIATIDGNSPARVVQLKVKNDGLYSSLTPNSSDESSYTRVPFSFVGMVVMGTNLTDEASVKAIYGSSTSWTKLSEVLVTSANVFGNGKALALTSGGSDLKGMRFSTSTNNHLYPQKDVYGIDLPNTSGGSGTSGDVTTLSGIGVPTKTQLGEHPEYSGLVVDTETVYSWKRTA